MFTYLPRRGPPPQPTRPRPAAPRAAARLRRLAAVLAGVTATLLASVATIPAACNNANPPGEKGGTSAITPAQCMQGRGYREAISYLPTSRYWPLQGIETGIFLALALALAWFSFWRLGRRRT